MTRAWVTQNSENSFSIPLRDGIEPDNRGETTVPFCKRINKEVYAVFPAWLWKFSTIGLLMNMTALFANSRKRTLSKSHQMKSRENNSTSPIRLWYEKLPKQRRTLLCTLPHRMQFPNLHRLTSASNLLCRYITSFGTYCPGKEHIPW